MRSAKRLILYLCRALGLFGLARRHTRSRLRILCYHGFELADETAFRPKLFIKPQLFEKRLATIRRMGFRVLSLDEAVDKLYAETLPPDSMVITTDDGFHSFARVAVPLLARHGYPATVYVTTYYVTHPNPIFRLVVQYMFWKTRVRQVRLHWGGDGGERVIDLTDARAAHRAMWDCIDFGEQRSSEPERRSFCERLGVLLQVPYDDIVRSKMLTLMSPEELRGLARFNVAIELHSHRHRFSADDSTEAAREIADNRSSLALWIDGERRHFCYPSGLWDEKQWSWLERCHVKSATTCVPGLNDASTPRYALRRFLDSAEVHPIEFEAAVSGFSDLVRALFRRARL